MKLLWQWNNLFTNKKGEVQPWNKFPFTTSLIRSSFSWQRGLCCSAHGIPSLQNKVSEVFWIMISFYFVDIFFYTITYFCCWECSGANAMKEHDKMMKRSETRCFLKWQLLTVSVFFFFTSNLQYVCIQFLPIYVFLNETVKRHFGCACTAMVPVLWKWTKL